MYHFLRLLALIAIFFCGGFGCARKISPISLVICESGTLAKIFSGDNNSASSFSDREQVARTLEATASSLAKRDSSALLTLGPLTVTRSDLISSNLIIADSVRQWGEGEALAKFLERNFIAICSEDSGKGLITGYYEPVIYGSLVPTPAHRFPLYGLPDDLVHSEDSKRFTLGRARRISDGSLVPYFSRKQIDYEQALSGRGLEIAWLKDPVDRAFLHIQGSGQIVLPDNRIVKVGFADKNGHPYRPIGRYLIEQGFLTSSEVSMQRIRAFLRENPQYLQQTLTYDESYVFFRIISSAEGEGPIGSLGVPLTPQRSVAVDPKIYPLGTPLFVETVAVDSEGSSEEKFKLEPLMGIMSAQDTGGAIVGVERVDIFFGTGEKSGFRAGMQKYPGRVVAVIKSDCYGCKNRN